MSEPVKDLRTIGDSVRAAREARKISQRDLALASGLGLPTLRALEDGIPNPPFEDLIRLADALDTRIAVLVRDAETRMRELEAAGSRHWQLRRSADELEATLTFTLRGGRLANFVASRLLFKRDN